MENVPASGSSAQVKPPRDFLKCQFCRDKKRKCEEYNFEKGEKCRSCVAGKNPCGPRIPHSARDPSQAAATPSSSTPSSTAFFRISSSLPPSSVSTRSSQSFGAAPYTPSPVPATPNFAPPDSFQKSKPRWSISYDANHESRAPSAKGLVRTKLLELGYQGDLFENLSNRLDATANAQPDAGLRPHDDVENMIKSLLDLVREKGTLLCEQILNNLSNVTSRPEKELFLRSFNDKVAYFLTLAPASAEGGGNAQPYDGDAGSSQHNQEDDFRDMKSMHYFAASQLATLLEESGDFSEALRQKRRIATLGQLYRITDDPKEFPPSCEAFERLSTGIGDAFRCLRIPARFARLLPKMDNIFPPTHLAVHHHYAETALKLLRAGADPQACDILKRQAIQIAAETGNLEMLQLALGRHGSAKSARDLFEQTALCIAAYMGDLDVFTHLLAAGDDMSVRDGARRSVLAIASGAGNLAIVQCLLEHGCRANDAKELQPLGVPSALHAAARGGHTACADLLLACGASALVQCQGLTPAQIAQAHGHKDLAQRLSAAEQEEDAQLSDKVLLAEQAFIGTLVADEAFMPQISSSSTSPYSLQPALTPSLSVTMGTPLPISAPVLDHHRDLSTEIARPRSPLGFLAIPSPRVPETSLSSALTFSRKRSHPSTSHRSSPCPSDISSQTSCGPLKRHQTSDL